MRYREVAAACRNTLCYLEVVDFQLLLKESKMKLPKRKPGHRLEDIALVILKIIEIILEWFRDF